jgi:hypothetical protein
MLSRKGLTRQLLDAGRRSSLLNLSGLNGLRTYRAVPERSQKLLDALYAKALDGDNKAAQLYLQATNRLAPTQIKVEHSQKLDEISDAELDALIARAALGEKHIRQETANFAKELKSL